MRAFAALYHALDATTRSSEKIAALAGYFGEAPDEDAAWAVYFLTGERLRRLVTSRRLRDWCAEVSGLAPWLIDASHETVGDLSETLALLVPGEGRPEATRAESLADTVRARVEPLASGDDASRRAVVLAAWRDFGPDERLVYHKIVRGGFRVGVQKKTLARALARVAGIEPAEMTHRMMALAGGFTPTARAYRGLVEGRRDEASVAPYPFFLASPVEEAPRALAPADEAGEREAERVAAALGPVDEWICEWKWDGIRAQLVRRGEAASIWSRGEELLDGSFPELLAEARRLPPGTVLDGEVVAWEGRFEVAGDAAPAGAGHGPLPFFELQRRVHRHEPTMMLFPDPPVRFVAFDLLEAGGEDLRDRPLEERRRRLAGILERGEDGAGEASRLHPSPVLEPADWAAAAALRAQSRARLVEGLVLKRRSSPYRTGRVRGDWWKWKIDPFTIDAVLMYSRAGTGRRAGLLTDHTFGVWREDELVPIAKAYGGLTDEEMKQVDRILRAATRERRGGVRIVEPELVFELAFDGVQRSDRHKSGLALRFPRMHRWRRDKEPADADRIEDLERLFRIARGREVGR